MNQEELLNVYNDVKEQIDTAPESPVPYPVVQNEKMSVIGDANETEINPRDFKIEFEFPKGTVNGKETDTGVLKEIDFKDIWITPRQRSKVVAAVCKLMPFFRKIDENGDREYTREEVEELMAEFGDEMIDNLYDLVAMVLKIDPTIVDFMTYRSAIDASVKILNNFPEVINEAMAFFS